MKGSDILIGTRKNEISTEVVIKKVNGDDALKFANIIFKKMMTSCRAGKNTFKTDQDKDEYVVMFCKLLIERGVNSVKSAEAAIVELQEKEELFAPSPSEFVTMILRHQYGIAKLPPAHIAYENACLSIHDDVRYKWPHDVVKEAAIRTGSYNLKTKGKNDVFPSFEYYLKEVIDEVISGKKLVFKISDEIILPKPFIATNETRATSKTNIAILREIARKQNARYNSHAV